MDPYQNPYTTRNYEDQPQQPWRGRGRGRGGGNSWRGQAQQNWRGGGGGGRGAWRGNNSWNRGGGNQWRGSSNEQSVDHSDQPPPPQQEFDPSRFVIPRMTENPWARLEAAYFAKKGIEPKAWKSILGS